jgi:hypothetical protein
MLTFALVPFVFAYFYWYNRHLSIKVIDKNLDLLQRLKQLCRSSVAIPMCLPNAGIVNVISESVDMGLSCSAGLTQSAVWLRLFKIQSLKAHKLINMWIMRLLAVMGISLVVRWYLVDSATATYFGLTSSDRFLILFSGLAALGGTVVFFKLVPSVTIIGGNEVDGLSAWLRDRIYVESGIQIASDTKSILKFETSEKCTGIGLANEKIDALDEIWRTRIDTIEKEAETASEVMPFLELVFFGLFIVCILLEPSLKFVG